MSSLLMMVVVIGVIAVGVMKRCDWLGICDAGAVPGGTPTDAAVDTDNTKSSKSGCCTCLQKATNLITCTTSFGQKVDFTGGLSLDAQTKACSADKKLCPKKGDTVSDEIKKSSAGQKVTTDEVALKNAQVNVCDTKRCKDNPNDFICKQSNCFKSVIKDLTKNVQTFKPLVKKPGTDACGCGKNQIAITTPGPNGTLVCGKCSGYTRVVSGFASSRFARVAI